MYKGASQNAQGRRDRSVVNDIAVNAGRKETQTPSQQRENLLRAVENLESQLKVAKERDDKKAVKLIIAEKIKRQNELTALKPLLAFKRRSRSDLSGFFIDAAKARLSKFQFDVLMRDAQRAFDEQEALLAAGDLPPANPFEGVERL